MNCFQETCASYLQSMASISSKKTRFSMFVKRSNAARFDVSHLFHETISSRYVSFRAAKHVL